MKRKSDYVNRVELLITLDYLLNHTDEKHPATCPLICKHATEFGFVYDPNKRVGNEINRHRISRTLEFLYDFTSQYPDHFPFALEVTKGGKYYVDQKNSLHIEQIAKVLAAIKNDKYTQDENIKYLFETVLDVFASSEFNKKTIVDRCKKLELDTKKYTKEDLIKLNIVQKAFEEGLKIRVFGDIFDEKTGRRVFEDFWCRVYFIKEIRDRPYCFLIPIDLKGYNFINNYIFQEITKLKIPLKEKDALAIDYAVDRDLNKLFMQQNKVASKLYKNIDELIEKNIIPLGGGLASSEEVVFILKTKDFNVVSRSFEESFSTSLIKHCSLCKEIKLIKRDQHFEAEIIDSVEDLKDSKWVVVKISINVASFESWLLSDIDGEGSFNISDLIILVSPKYIINDVANYYQRHLSHHLKKYKKINAK